MNSRQQQAIETKTKIFQSFIKLLESVNYEKITVRSICKDAGVSVGTFYVHFKSRDSIFLEVNDRLELLFSDSGINELKNHKAKDKIIMLADVLAKFIMNYPIVIAKHVFASYLLSEDLSALHRESRMYKYMHDVVLRGVNDGSFTSNIESEKITLQIVRFVRGIIYDWLITNGEYNLSETVSEDLERYLTLFEKS